MDASIVIPTKNAEKTLDSVLGAVFSQDTEYEYEVICIDSGSEDDTIAIIKKYPCMLFQISPEEFGHGKTRNYGASQGTGEFIVFLTQDALPANHHWLQAFIEAMKTDETIAGGFGIHYPYPDCNVLDKRDLKRHFQNFGNENHVFFIEDEKLYFNDKGYQQYLGFFSDNNSCLRRSVWEKIPYQDVDFAEDQIWACEVLEAGYKKIYCPCAAVYHSHNYPLKTYFHRYYDEFKGLYQVYSWKMFHSMGEFVSTLIRMDCEDVFYICDKENKITGKFRWILYALRRNYYRCMGAYLAGAYYTTYPSLVREYLDTHISQQYQQIYGGTNSVEQKRKKNWGEFLKWLVLNPDLYGEKKQPLRQYREFSGTQIDLFQQYEFVISEKGKVSLSREDYEKNKNGKVILNWVIPEPGIGGGGHINIFRFVRRLEKMGIHSRIYLMYPGQFKTDAECEAFLEKYYEMEVDEIEVHIHLENMKFAHGIVATSWQTAYPVKKFDNVISKFYFVQDYEPFFFPVGTEYTFAENTYKFGFRGLTAGDWLKDKLCEEYGMNTDSFSFSYDRELYTPGEKRDLRKRIFFYARPYTPRRAFEIGVLALDKVARKIPDLEVLFAGEDISKYRIEFKHVNAGIVPLSQLSDLYAQCDMCLVLSDTNLSLLPLEVMASNSVAVCSKGKNSEWLVNEDNSVMVDLEVEAIADKLVYYLEHPKKLQKIREKGLKFAQNTSWDREAEKVKNAVIRGIEEDEKNIHFRW